MAILFLAIMVFDLYIIFTFLRSNPKRQRFTLIHEGQIWSLHQSLRILICRANGENFYPCQSC